MEMAPRVETLETAQCRRSGPGQPPGSASEQARVRAVELADEMARAWGRGECPGTEVFLARSPEVAGSPDAALLLLHEEIRLRSVAGLTPGATELLRRFPQWHKELEGLLRASDQDLPARAPDFPGCGEWVGDWQLLAELGRGVEGRVFLARGVGRDDEPLVLKLTPAQDQEHLALARLIHPHIVPLQIIHDCPERNLRVLGMPYRGSATLDKVLAALAPVPPAERSSPLLLDTLDRVQASGPGPVLPVERRLTPREPASYVEAVCWIGVCLADALDHAHGRGLIHMDIKPSNLLLGTDGQPLLLDFHLARPPLEAGAPPPEKFGGTRPYMSPEQERVFEAIRVARRVPRRVDGRSDLYSLGLVLYEMLAGSLPEGPGRMLPLWRVNPRVNPALSGVIERSLARKPSDRHPDARSLAADLRRFLQGGKEWRAEGRQEPSTPNFPMQRCASGRA